MASPIGTDDIVPGEGSKENEQRFEIPPGACDCHVHVFDPERFPYSPTRTYTPGPASLDDLLAFEGRIGMSRCVLVQPSVYGTDNSCLVAALNRLGDQARGVAVIDLERTSDRELDGLGAAGVCSVRINLKTQGETDPAAAARVLAATSRRLAGYGWSIQVYTELSILAALKDDIARLPVPLVVDHFGGARGAGGTGQPGLADLIQLLESGNVYLKLSAPYRSSSHEPGYEDMTPIARALIDAAPERLVWASDWPHTGGGLAEAGHRLHRSVADIEPFRQVDVPRLLSLLADWSDDVRTWRRILVDNPAGLYGFS
jgi:predicted TIM-barrel fold metal-dependent hydrolase